MIGISKLYLGTAELSDSLRYRRPEGRKPIVVWNLTRRCNLDCLHCYADACPPGEPCSEVDTLAAKRVIASLAAFGVPVLLFSGGEPLLREDLPELAAWAGEKGIRTVVSSNGTLLDPEKARALQQAGVSYVGISLDGLEPVHNFLRRNSAAFAQTLAGLAAARSAGLKTGLRVTLTRENIPQIREIFALSNQYQIDRICFYHLVGAGRGSRLAAMRPDAGQTRQALDMIIDATAADFAAGQALLPQNKNAPGDQAPAGSQKGLCPGYKQKEVLTVDNHADGAYLWMRLARENPARARQVWELLSLSGGASSGVGIAAINWRGDVLPDQFWQSRVLGNVFRQSFEEIWAGRGRSQPGQEPPAEFLARLRNKQAHVQGRCGRCRFLSVCGGNFRVRAELATGNPWAEDPACYLSEQEIFGPAPYTADQ